MNDELLQKALRGDPDAFMQLMQSHMQLMYKTARSILSSDADVADAVQEAILRCWEKMGSLREPAFFRAWMIRILVNCCYDQLRAHKTVPLSAGRAGTEDASGADPDLPYQENAYNTAEWVQVLNTLEETYRLPMVLYYIDGLTAGEIAKMLGISEGAVRTRLSRGRAQLSEELKEDAQ